MSSLPPRIRCREIGVADIDSIANLLAVGFRKRTRDFWVRALRRLSEHHTPPGLPRYGYLMENRGTHIGVILLISSAIVTNKETRIRCNVSSWYVEPTYRSYAGMMVSHALRHKHVTYFNITPDRHTLPILEAQGYVRYCSGRLISAPVPFGWCCGSRIQLAEPGICADEDLPFSEIELLLQHAAYGCISVICSSANRRYPFVFLPRWKAGVVPFAYLAYCRHLDDFVRFSGPLGRFLARRGFPLIALDTNGAIGGLVGKYYDDAPKYFKGPDQPRLGDIAYSERVMFGF
jgi:hypothetical protein